MSTIIASHIPTTISVSKVQEFFSFCGKIKAVNALEKSDKFQSYEIVFESQKALSTALLLNDAELDGVPIEVHQATEGSSKVQTHGISKNVSAGSSTDLPPQYNDVTDGKHYTASDNKQSTGDSNYDDISQEEKPKYAIMAQLLSNGYILSDKVVEKSIEVDKEKGISSSFKNFLSNLDSKYIHSQEPDSSVNENLSKAQSTLGSWGESLANSSYTAKLSHYYEQAAATPYGAKVHDFYKSISKDVKGIHEEAKRLTELKKAQEDKTKLEPNVASANAAAAINSAN